jgi:hypothetical protein
MTKPVNIYFASNSAALDENHQPQRFGDAPEASPDGGEEPAAPLEVRQALENVGRRGQKQGLHEAAVGEEAPDGRKEGDARQPQE